MDIAILSIAGLIGGFIGAEVGGGAMVTLPVLLFMGLEPAAAVATNALAAFLINLVASLDYWKSRKLNFNIVLHLGPIAFLGSLIGAELLTVFSSETTSKILIVLFLSLLIFLLFTFKNKTLGLNPSKANIGPITKAIAAVGAFLLGVYGGFFTVAVTTLFVFFIVVFLNQSFLQAAADSVAISAILLVGSLSVFIYQGIIDYRLATPLAISAIIGSHLGAKTALKYGSRWIRIILFFMVLATVARLVI